MDQGRATGVAVWTAGRSVTLRTSPALPCASVLLPVYAWVSDHPHWEQLAHAMVADSDDAATDVLVGDVEALRARVLDRTGVVLGGGASWWSIPVSAEDVASAYGSMVVADDERSRSIRTWMTQVARAQWIGTRAAAPVGQHVGVKAGWGLQPIEGTASLLTHVVLTTDRGVVAALTSRPSSTARSRAWHAALANAGPHEVLSTHLAVAGHALELALREGLDVLTAAVAPHSSAL